MVVCLCLFNFSFKFMFSSSWIGMSWLNILMTFNHEHEFIYFVLTFNPTLLFVWAPMIIIATMIRTTFAKKGLNYLKCIKT